MSRLASVILASTLVVSLAACAKHDDAAAGNGTTADSGANATIAPLSDALKLTPERMASLGIKPAVGNELNALGVPVYPNAKLKPDGDVIDETTKGVRTISVFFDTADDFAAVQSWYKTHVDAGYSATDDSSSGMQFSHFDSGEYDTYPQRKLTVGLAHFKGPDTEIGVLLKEKAP